MPFVIPVMLQWIMLAITVASTIYQRQQASKMRKAQAAAADKQKGFQLTTEGESASINVMYGRNKVGGTRVFHKVSGNYIYAAPAEGGIAFTSKGDTRSLARVESSVGVNKVSLTYTPMGALDITTIDVPFPEVQAQIVNNRMTLHLPVDNPLKDLLIPNGQTAFSYLAVTHKPYLRDPQGGFGGLIFDVSWMTSNYQVMGYDKVTGELILKTPNGISDYTTSGMSANVWNTKNEFLYIQQVIGYKGISNVYCVDINNQDYRNASFGDSSRIHVYTDGNVVDPMMEINHSSRIDAKFSNSAYASMVFRLDRDKPQYSGIPNVQFYVEGMKVRKVNFDGHNYTLSTTREYSNSPALCLLDYLLDSDYGKGLRPNQIDLESFYKANRICQTVVPIPVEVVEPVPEPAPVYDDNGELIPQEGPVVSNTLGKFWTEKQKTHDKVLFLYECNIGIDTSTSIRDNIDIILNCMNNADLVWSGGTYKLQLEYPMEYSSMHTELKNYRGYSIPLLTMIPGPGLYNKGDVVQYPPGPATNIMLYRSLVDNNSETPGPEAVQWTSAITATITDDELLVTDEISQVWPSSQNKLNFCSVKFLNESKDFAEDSVTWPPKHDSQNPVYATYLAEDNGQQLESELFQQGDTSFYHAMATAEERVRSSRSQTVYKFGVSIKYSSLEPGDYIKVSSDSLGIPGEVMIVDEVKVSEHNTALIQAIKVDARNLAWNAKDNEVVPIRNVYNTDLGQASGIQFSSTPQVNGMSSGFVSWTRAFDSRIVKYIVKITNDSISQVTEDTVWQDLGNTDGTSLDVPVLKAGAYTLTVVAVSSTGVTAPFFNRVTGSRWPLLSVVAGQSAAGVSVANLQLFKRSAVPLTEAPVNVAKPFGGTYNFITSEMMNIPAGWSPIIPVGDEALYVSQCVAKVQFPAFVADELVWNTPKLFMQNGMSSRNLIAFTRGVPTKAPTGGSFTFPNGTGADPLGVAPTSDDGTTWSMIVPEGDTALYQSVATATLPGQTGINTNILQWSNPSVVVAPADLVAEIYLYKWSTAAESGPTTGVTTFTWADGTQAVKTAINNGWAVSAPANPGTPGITLFRTKKRVVAKSGTVSTDVSWSIDRTVEAVTMNGQDGVKTTEFKVFKWAASIPTITGNSVYTWSSGTINTVPTGWSLSSGTAPNSGMTLYQATIRLTDIASSLTTNIAWVGAGIQAIGFYGVAGDSYRTAYTKTSAGSLASTPTTITTSGKTSFPPASSWGGGSWGADTMSLAAGESMYQSDGIYSATTDSTVWSAPYLSSLKVGSLSAITTNTGTLNVSGTISSSNGRFTVDQLGNVNMQSVTIRDSGGNIIFTSSNSGIDYDKIIGTKPPANATAGATIGSNLNGSFTGGNIGNFFGAGVIGGTYIANAAISLAKIDTASIGSLSALSANLGTLTAGTIGSAVIYGGSYNANFAWPSNGGIGYHLSSQGLLLGNPATGKYVRIDSTGNFYAPGLTIENGVCTYSGSFQAGSITTDHLIANGISEVDIFNNTEYDTPGIYYFSVSRSSKVSISVNVWFSGDGGVEANHGFGTVELQTAGGSTLQVGYPSFNPGLAYGTASLGANLSPGTYRIVGTSRWNGGALPIGAYILKVMR